MARGRATQNGALAGRGDRGQASSTSLTHTKYGLMTMDDWLDTYERHIPDHVVQMQAIYDDWFRTIAQQRNVLST